MRNTVAPIVCAGLLHLASLQGYVAQDVTSTLVPETVEVGQPLAPCEAADVVGMIARVAGIPAGVEYVPGDCGYRHSARSAARESLQGLSVREALDRIVQWDPRYRWQLLDGVISFRPVETSARSDHFLHTVGELQLVDETVGAAFVAVMAILGAKRFGPPPPRTPLAEKRLSLSLSNVSAVAALDAVVREHGSAWWEVRYCQPEAARRYATVFLRTFDKGGIGVRLDQSFRSRKAIDPCAHDVGMEQR